MNTITIELSAQDRERQDSLIEKMDELIKVLEALKGTGDRAQAPTAPQETAEAAAPVNTQPEEETPAPACEAAQEEGEQIPIDSTEEEAPAVTLEQIQQKVVQLAAADPENKAKLREIIGLYGTKVSDLKDQPEKWGEVWKKLTALEG